ncbi:cytochrome P450 [Ramaria rubella]|nr:cytochrome P450 [Ramaria rubella]
MPEFPYLCVFIWLGAFIVALLCLVVLVGLGWFLKLYWDEKTDPLRDLRGLEAPFFEPLCGCVLSAEPSKHSVWEENLGRTFRFNGFGKFDYRLVTTDVRALTHVLNSPLYEKPWQTQKVLSSFLGRGISVMEGVEHARQRKIVSPPFSNQNVRRLYAPIFVEKAAQLCDAWHAAITAEHKSTQVNVAHWLGRATLDVVGLACEYFILSQRRCPVTKIVCVAFDHNFDAIRHENEEIYLAYKQIFDQITCDAGFRFLVELMFPWLVTVWPSDLSKTIRKNMRIVHRFGRMAVQDRQRLAPPETFYSSDSKISANGDLLSRLIEANTNPMLHASQRLTEQELLDQINTFLFAGSDSTAMAISWCLHFISLHPTIQSRLRDEISSLQFVLDQEEHASQIDSLPFLESVVKETLRLCPPVHSTIRVATQNDVIPLSEPLVLRDGRTVGEIKIRKGSFIHVPLEGFNISTSIWGNDATVFNPDRWSNLPLAARSHPGLAGLLTFSFGGHACPGWKFALTEMKVFIASLVLRFVFSPSEEIKRINLIIQRPYVKNKWELGPRLPLNVQLYTA